MAKLKEYKKEKKVSCKSIQKFFDSMKPQTPTSTEKK